ncbi:hypothetical protein [Lactiplantibacillus plantarum]|uniref:hypothetical protein n=1 Tax=Lactiplantibacillus plantarum TaxID=1590 RepID=UPI001BA8856C|nr:hypothetical protein [Lactiplantibacillus plantarum]MBS0935694.1 hypothetical protein [Lactiplantibacillus plantarum]MBS0943949.1 hypothetical protein [Lactiplantibacillus plantarum]
MIMSRSQVKVPATPLMAAKQQAQAELTTKEAKKILSMEKLLGYQGFTTDEHHYLVLSDNRGFAEICRIPGVGLTSLPDNMLSQPTGELTGFLQRYDADWTFIATQFPATTARQQTHLSQDYLRAEQKLIACDEPEQRQALTTRLQYINEALQIARAVEKTLKNQEYLALIFAPTVRELTERMGLLRQRRGQYLNFEPLTLERKTTFLYSLNNMADKKI